MPAEGILLGFGHPLLDITADVTEDFLNKYGLEPNAVILGGDQQANLIKDLVDTFPVRYSAGGSVQNVCRVAQHILRHPKSCTFVGTVGDDANGRILLEHAQRDGLDALYVIDYNEPTGVCAVLLTDAGRNRSLVSFIAAAAVYDRPHLMMQWPAVERASIYYCSGFSIRTGFAAVHELAIHSASSDRKTFSINLSAPYICEAFTEQIMQLLPLVDIVFGNDTEAKALARALNWQTDDLSMIVSRLAAMPCSPQKKDANAGGRLVIITSGDQPVLVGRGQAKVTSYKVPPVERSKIVDTNGAGDAFVGGFLAAFGKNKMIDNCVQTGIGCAAKIIQVTGCNLSVFK